MGNCLEDKRALVTGAAGCVGFHLCERLLREKVEVVGFEREIPWISASLRDLREKIKFCYGDLRDYASVLNAMENIDMVFHLGAQPSVPTSVIDPYGTFMVNAVGTLNCLEAARKNDVDLFVFAGTAKICGDPLYLPLDEEHPQRPRAPYDASKVAAEALCMAYYKTYGLKTSMIRFTNTYGPRMDRRRVVTEFIYYLLRNEPPVIRSDGTPTRDYIYIDDVIDAYVKVTQVPEAVGEIFLICTSIETSVLELCNLLIEVSGVHQKPVILNKPIIGEIPHEYATNAKAKKILNWSPKIDLRTGLSLTWKWFRAHPEFA